MAAKALEIRVSLSGTVLASALVHAALLWHAGTALPPLGDVDEDDVGYQRYLMRTELIGTTEREPERWPAPAEDMPGTGIHDGGAPRWLGSPGSRRDDFRYGVRGPADNPDPHIARVETPENHVEWVIWPMEGASDGSLDEPIAPWGRDDSLGTDPISGKGNMWGERIGDTRGAAGLSGAGGVALEHT